VGKETKVEVRRLADFLEAASAEGLGEVLTPEEADRPPRFDDLERVGPGEERRERVGEIREGVDASPHSTVLPPALASALAPAVLAPAVLGRCSGRRLSIGPNRPARTIRPYRLRCGEESEGVDGGVELDARPAAQELVGHDAVREPALGDDLGDPGGEQQGE